MTIKLDPIRTVDLKKIDEKGFANSYVGCIVLTHDQKILLQKRPDSWHTFPDSLSTFGGHIELNETPMQAVVRELREELGSNVNPIDVINLGVITEAITRYSELIYCYFWHDKDDTITGCYECEASYYNDCAEALSNPKIMDDVRWMLKECQKHKLLK